MICEAELHGSVTRMVYSILSHIGSGKASADSAKLQSDGALNAVIK